MDYNDYELIYYVSENSDEANEIIIQKYKPIIKLIASKYIHYTKSCGIDENDLYQEGLIGLNNAIKTYDQNSSMFYTYAKVCIERQIISLTRTVTRQKNEHLNKSFSLDIYDDEKGLNLYEAIADSQSETGLSTMIQKENIEEINLLIENNLSELEKKVLLLKVEAMNYDEISETLNISKKSIDNTVQRIKTKLRDKINELELTNI